MGYCHGMSPNCSLPERSGLCALLLESFGPNAICDLKLMTTPWLTYGLLVILDMLVKMLVAFLTQNLRCET